MVFPAVFNLSSLNGQNGFTINGKNAGDQSGFSVSSAGDFNGDGIADIIIGAPNVNYEAGASYIVFGSKYEFPTTINSTWLIGQNGFTINGINAGDNSGSSVSSAGDFNGDGFDDIIIAAAGAYNNNGQSYMIFGSKGEFTSSFNLSSLNGSNGFAIIGNINDGSGQSVSSAGDVNGDGFDDIIIGAPDVDKYYMAQGQSYVIFGSKGEFTSSFNLSSLNGSNGFAVFGNVNDEPFELISGAGDVNADGFDDIIICNTQSYVVFGTKSAFTSPFNLSSLNGSNGFTIIDGTGCIDSGAGDINNDGFDDIIIDASFYRPNGRHVLPQFQSDVIFGSNQGFAPIFNLSSVNGTNGFIINDNDAGAVYSVSAVGDVNSDGIADVIIGFESVYGGEVGKSFVIFGSNQGFAPIFNLTSLNGTNGFVINGINNDDYTGCSVSGAGDVNDDGIADIIIGAYGAKSSAGQSYVVFGQKSSIDNNHELAGETAENFGDVV